MSNYTPPNTKSKQYPKLLASLPSQAGKVVAITGCTTGTGFAAARAAAKLGAEVVMLNRPSERATKAKDKLLEEYPEAKVTHIPCDLSKFETVRQAAAELKEKFSQGIDVLCCNAGIMAMPTAAGPDGYEVQMTTNHLAHFLLCKEVFPLLEAAAAKTGDARIVNHSSMSRKDPNTPLEAKYYQKDMTCLGDDSEKMGGGRWVRYHQTKLANCVFTYALKEKLAAKSSKVKAMVATPGLANTDLQVTTAKSGGLPSIINMIAPWLMQSAEDGACGIITCMFDPKVLCASQTLSMSGSKSQLLARQSPTPLASLSLSVIIFRNDLFCHPVYPLQRRLFRSSAPQPFNPST